jgi:hypothetical protein
MFQWYGSTWLLRTIREHGLSYDSALNQAGCRSRTSAHDIRIACLLYSNLGYSSFAPPTSEAAMKSASFAERSGTAETGQPCLHKEQESNHSQWICCMFRSSQNCAPFGPDHFAVFFSLSLPFLKGEGREELARE